MKQDENEPFRVLLVEDAPDNRNLIRAYVKKAGILVDEAENGQVGFEKFRQEIYDLVLMDIQMPVMDGYTATSMMREWENQEQKPETPIVALSAHALQEEIRRSMEMGCNDYLLKPIMKADLVAAVNKWAQKGREQKQQNTQQSKGQGGNGNGSTRVYEVEAAADLADLIPDFLQNRKNDLTVLDESLQAKDLDQVARVAHTMKGVCRPYGFDHLDGLSRELETMAKSGDQAGAEKVCGEIRDFLDHVHVIYPEEGHRPSPM